VHALLAIRLLLIGNGCMLAIVGVLFVLFADPPWGRVVGAATLLFAGVLFAGVPFTDPYRNERSRR
jgi:hypothetical protein